MFPGQHKLKKKKSLKLAPFKLPLQGVNQMLLCRLTFLYKRYNHGIRGQSCLAF